MSIAPYRLFIFPSDVTALHDCSKSTASRKLTELKEATGKAKHHEVTIAEYCEYYGLNYENICKFLNLVK